MADTDYRITTNGKRFRIEQLRQVLNASPYVNPQVVWDAMGETYATLAEAEDMLDLLKDREGPWVPVEDAAVRS